MYALKKGQNSSEYVPIIILIIGLMIFIAYNFANENSSQLIIDKANSAVQALASASNGLSKLAEGNVKCVNLNVPSNVKAFGAAKNEVYMIVETKGDVSDVVAKTEAPGTGILPVKKGKTTICISNTLENGLSTGNNHFYEKGATCDSDDGCVSYCGTSSDADCSSGDYGNMAGSFCGDSLLNGNEECDVGLICDPGFTCSSSCVCEIVSENAACGNGVVNQGEQCDTAGRDCFWASKSCPSDSPSRKSSCKEDCTCTSPQPVYSCGDGIPPQGGFGTANSCGVTEECEKREECPQFLAGDMGVSCVNCKCIASPVFCESSAAPACGGICLNTGEICKDNGNGFCQCVPECGGDEGLCSGECKKQDETCSSRPDETGKPACQCVKGGLQQQYIAGQIGGPCLGGEIASSCGGSCDQGICMPDAGTGECTCS